MGAVGPLVTSLIIGTTWGVWHLPVFYIRGTNQSLVPFWLFTLSVIPLGVMMTWVYNKQSVWLSSADG